jgi:hypothetical protein
VGLNGREVVMDHTDAVLIEVVARAEADPGFCPGIALLVDGLFVSGVVTSSTNFLAALNLALQPAADERGDSPKYIHLRHTKFYAGSGQQIEERTSDSFWRCPIAAVTGFKLGTLHHMASRIGEVEPRRQWQLSEAY